MAGLEPPVRTQKSFYTIFFDIDIFKNSDLLKVAVLVSQLSFADFMMYDYMDQLRTFEPSTLDPFQNITDFMARIEVSKMNSQHLLREIL